MRLCVTTRFSKYPSLFMILVGIAHLLSDKRFVANLRYFHDHSMFLAQIPPSLRPGSRMIWGTKFDFCSSGCKHRPRSLNTRCTAP